MEFGDTIVGVIVGGLLAAIGFIYQRRAEKLKVMNKSLYQLLTLYRSVNQSTLNHSVLIDLILQVFEELVPGITNESSIKELERQYAGMFSELLGAFRFEDEELLAIYLDAVNSLSTINPVLAYRLSGNVAFKRYLAFVDEKLKRNRESASLELSENNMKIVDEYNKRASEMITADVMKELKTDLLILSMKCGIFTFISVLRRLMRSHKFSSSERLEIKSQMKNFIVSGIRAHQVECSGSDQRNRG